LVNELHASPQFVVNRNSIDQPSLNCPIMLLAPTLTERVILPAAWGDSYFFNRIDPKLSFTEGG